jgi:hypothetical protein
MCRDEDLAYASDRPGALALIIHTGRWLPQSVPGSRRQREF